MGQLTRKIQIYDNADYNIAEKLGAPSETGSAEKAFWSSDYEIDVISSETDEKLYTVQMEPDGSWLQAKIFRMAWNEKGHFDFELFDDYFQEIKDSRVRLHMAVNRIRNPYELSKEAESEYLDYIRKKAKDVIKYSIDCDYRDMLEFFSDQGLLKKNNIDELIHYADNNGNDWWQKNLSDWKAEKKSSKKTSEKWIKDPIHEDWVFGKNLDGTYSIEKYRGKEEYITIPSEYRGHQITSLGYRAFSGYQSPKCKQIISIVIPKGVTSIGIECFYQCENLRFLKWPDTITEVHSMALSGCKMLSFNRYEHGYYLGDDDNPYACFFEAEKNFGGSLVIHKDTTFLFDGGVSYGKITHAVIPEGIKVIPHGFFNGCMNLESVELPDDVECIKANCFNTCIKLSDIQLPDSLKEIGAEAFLACRSIDEITLPEGITEIKKTTFHNCNNLNKVRLPNTITTIGFFAFKGCENLSEINIPDGLKEVDSTAFDGCPEKIQSLFSKYTK